MSLRGARLLVCLLLSCVSVCPGLELTIDRTPGSQYCAQLRCEQTVSQTDQQISYIIGLSIYNLTSENTRRKFASISEFDPVLYIDHSKVKVINGTGSITRTRGQLILSFQEVTDCVEGSFLCELDFVDVSGQPDTITEITRPVDSGSCTLLEEQVRTLTAQVNSLTSSTQTALAALEQENTVLEGKISQLTQNNTVLEGKVTSVTQENAILEVKVTQLIQNDTILEGKVTQLTQENVILEGKVTDLAQNNTVLEGKVTQMAQENVVLEGKVIELTQNNSVLESKVSLLTDKNLALQSSLDRVLQRLNMLEAQQQTCSKGISYNKTRQEFMLWGQMPALCDTQTDGGGWVIIQRRVTGDVNFNRNWTEYRKGFGTPDTDFWIGLDVIHSLTSQGFNELRVDLNYRGSPWFAHYSNCSIASESMNYQLSVSGFSGTADDGLASHNSQSFSTYDQDLSSRSCAETAKGGWWYSDDDCWYSNLNGPWGSPSVTWATLKTSNFANFTEMKLRRQ